MAMDGSMVDVAVDATGVAVEAVITGHDGHWNSKPAWKLPGWGEPVVCHFLLTWSSRFLHTPISSRVSRDEVEES